MAMEDDDTFSSDDDSSSSPASTSNPTSFKTYFETPDKQLIHADTEYDPKTGDNLTISKAAKMAPELKPVILMKAPDDSTPVRVPLDKVHFALSKGMKSLDQIDLEEKSNKEYSDIKQGNIPGYEPGKTTSFLGGLSRGATANVLPQLEGLGAGVDSLMQGRDFTPAYKQERDISEGVSRSQQKANPISSTIGNLVGSATTAGLTGGVTSIPKMALAGAGLGGASDALETANQGGNAYQIDKALQEGALGGGVESALAGGAAKGIQSLLGGLGKAGVGAIPKPITNSFKAGLDEVNLTDAPQATSFMKESAVYPKTLDTLQDSIKNQIGGVKQDLLENSGEISHKPVLDMIDKQQSKLLNDISKTGFTHERNSIQNAYDLLDEAKQDLINNPNDPVAIDKVKQKLQDRQFNDEKPIKQSKEALQSIHNVRNDIMNYLNDNIGNIKGTNLGYSDLARAEDATGLYSTQLSPGDVRSLGSKTPSDTAINKLDNLQTLSDKLKGNEILPQDLRTQLDTAINQIPDIAQRSNVARSVAEGGLPNLANQVGYALSKTPGPVKMLGKGVYQIPKALYKGLPLEIQKLLDANPSYSEIFRPYVENNDNGAR